MKTLENIQGAFLTIGTEKFTETVDFYRQFLQQEPYLYHPDKKYAEFQIRELRLAIFYPKTDQQKEFANSIGSGFSLCLPVKNLEVAIAQLACQGYTPKLEIQSSSHGREIYIYDPTNNRLILYQPH